MASRRGHVPTLLFTEAKPERPIPLPPLAGEPRPQAGYGRRALQQRLLYDTPGEYTKPAYLAHEASRIISQHKDRPFALYVNFLEPHMPFFSCRDDQYDRADVELPANFEATAYWSLHEKLVAARLSTSIPMCGLEGPDSTILGLMQPG